MTLQQISLAMIVYNEAEHLAQCLESVQHEVDEIIIVDTGSSDDTVLIAKQYTEKVYSYQWNNDFAAARNFAIQQTTCEWILSLDADEQLSIESGDLRSLISQSEEYCAFCLPLCALKATNAQCEFDRFMVLRFFQRSYHFKGAIHEYVAIDNPSAVGYALHPMILHTSVSLAKRRTRRGRNITLLKKAIAQNGTDPYLQYYIGTEWLGVRRADLAITSFQKALRQFSVQQAAFRSPTVRHLISCYKNIGKLDKAICLCLQESQNYPDYCDLFFDGGVLFELKGEYEVAIKWFQEAVKLNPPPLPFFHTDGTNGYLAYYHLGYCAEKLGLFKEAQKYYKQALAANKNYYYPLYPLVLLKLAEQSAIEVLNFLWEKEYLLIPEVAEKMMELFWAAGFPDISIQCLTNNISHSASSLELLVRCQLYSGEFTLALQSITALQQNGMQLTTEMIVDEITALLLLGRFDEARRIMWSLWHKPDCRDAFRAIFCLYKKLHHDTLLPLSNRKAVATLLDLRDRCLRVRAIGFREQQCFAKLLGVITTILLSDGETMALLIDDLQKREQAVKESMDYTFTALRGLYQ